LASKYVVTGGAGFIGSNLVHRLVADGNEVVVIDDLSTGSLNNLRGLDTPVKLVNGDIRDRELLKSLFLSAAAVFHQAALVSVPQSVKDPLMTNDINVHGTLCVLSSAREVGVKRVVLATTCAVYGDSPVVPKEESMTPSPMSPYASTKYMTEVYARMYSELYGLETVCLRYFNVYGPRQSSTSEYAAVVPKFISRMLRGERPIIFGDGTQSRDFVYVDDVVEANLAAATLPGISGETINVGSGKEYSINDLVHMLNQILGTSLAPCYRPKREGDLLRSLAATEHARKVLRFMPRVSLREGLEKTVDWYRHEMDTQSRLTAGTEHC
jgi:nucleoside-diphosphate-sugar epimerase